MLLCLLLLILPLSFSPVTAADNPNETLAGGNSPHASGSLSQVLVANQRVQLSGSQGVDNVKYFILDSPKRLVVDLYGVKPGSHDSTFSLESGFRVLRVGPYQDKTRFVFDVAGATFPTFNIDIEDHQVVVTWQPPSSMTKQASAEAKTEGVSRVTAIDFSSEAGRSQFLISTDGPVTATKSEASNNTVRFTLRETTIPRALRRVFDTLAFPSAIYSVTPYLVNVSNKPQVRFSVILKGDVKYELKKVAAGYLFTVEDGSFAVPEPRDPEMLPIAIAGGRESMPLARADAKVAAPTVPPSFQGSQGSVIQLPGSGSAHFTGEKITLIFDSADVRNVLQLIAEVSELNIIATDEVKGTITLRLIDVPWDQALDLVLEITGLGMLQEGNVVKVLPKDTIRSMKEAELTAVRSREKLEPLLTEVVTVSYADLGSVSGPTKDILSERGSITEDSRNKLLIITDVPARIKKARELIEILDTPERQVMIEARIVEVGSNYSRDLGVNWGIDYDDPGKKLNSAAIGLGGNFLVGLPGGGGSAATEAGLAAGATYGRIGVDTTVIDLRISALEVDGHAKVISTPKVTTLNGEEAVISQGTSIPYQTSGADGPKTEFVDAELKLQVVPVINPDNTIILDILATNDSPSLTDGATAPSIDTKKAETKVLVRDGETTVIGGIFVENVADTSAGTPWLKNLPVLGKLFGSSREATSKSELLIFITPRILEN